MTSRDDMEKKVSEEYKADVETLGVDAAQGLMFDGLVSSRLRIGVLTEKLEEKDKKIEWLREEVEHHYGLEIVIKDLHAKLAEKERILAEVQDALTAVLTDDTVNGYYIHSMMCSGDRRFRPGVPGHSCSCFPQQRRERIAELSDAFFTGAFVERGLPDYKTGGSHDYRDAMDVAFKKFLKTRTETE
jgi:hypothetical protein